MKINWTYATKFIVSVLGSVSAYLSTPSMTWRQAVILAIASVLVWLVPNTSNVTSITPVKQTVNPPVSVSEREELEALRRKVG